MAEPRQIQRVLEEVRECSLKRFSKVFVKELLIKIIAGLVKESPNTYFSEDLIDFKKI